MIISLTELENLQNKAVNRHLSGYNCAECVLMTMAEAEGIAGSNIPRIASGFGGGFGRRGLICGCVSGSLMFLGLKYGRDNETQKNDMLYLSVNKFCDEFESRFGILDCKGLIGLDLRTDEGKKMFDELKIRETKCSNFVRAAIEILYLN